MGSSRALDVDLLRTFQLIAEGRSFTRAAERIGRTQSAVSLQVQRLESQIGQRLFDRSKGGSVRLTAAGEDLLEHARDMTSLNDRIVVALDPNSDPGAMALPSLKWSGSRRRPSIAVLPFENIGAGPEQQYFVDGIVDDIITDLSRAKWLMVIARASSFSDRLKPLDPVQIGRELGVDYLLLGGVRRAGGRLRITAKLVDAKTADILWSERYDGPLDEVFELQDRVAEQVVGTIGPSLERAEIDRVKRKRTANLDAYELYLRALPFTAAHMPAGTEVALPLLERALKLEPDYAPARALMAWCYEWRFVRGGFDINNRDAALDHAEAVIGSDTDDATALAAAGFVASILDEDHEAGLSAQQRAVRLNDCSATVLYLASHAHAIANQMEAAAAFADRAFRLSPLDPLTFEANMALGNIAMCEGRYDDAASCFGRSARINPKYSSAVFHQATALALAGRNDDADRVVRKGWRLEPGYRTRIVFEIGMPPALTAHFVKGAGLLNLPV